MLTIKPKNPENNIEIKKIRASKHADSTKIHTTALLGIEYDCDIKLDKKHFIFVVDTSSSMNQKDITSDEGENISRIEAVRNAMSEIVFASPKASYSIVTFNKEAQVVLDGRDAYDAYNIIRERNNIKTGLGTSIYHGMLKIKELESFNNVPVNNTIVILLTDGYSSVISDEDSNLYSPETVKMIIAGRLPNIRHDPKHFDPKEVIKELTHNGECPRIFSMGIGVDYDREYITGLGDATNTPVTHITKQSDFIKALNLGLFNTSPIPAILEIQINDEVLHSEEVTLHSTKEQEIIFTLEKEILTGLFKNNVVQVEVGDNLPKNLNVDINQINEIDKGMALSYYKGIKCDMLSSTGNIQLSLMWDIPHTDGFDNDEDCKEERKKLFQEAKAFSDQNNTETLQIRSNIRYMKPTGYVRALLNQQLEEELEEEKEHICPIGLGVMMKPTSVLAFREKDGYASVQTYDKDDLLKYVGLDPANSNLDALRKVCRRGEIKDPNTRQRMIEPRRNYVKEEEINKAIEEKEPIKEIFENVMSEILSPEGIENTIKEIIEENKEIGGEASQAQLAGTMQSLDSIEQQSTSRNRSFGSR